MPSAKDEAHLTWRKEWLGEIKTTRDLDQNFRELIEKDRVFTCEKHFAAEDIEICIKSIVFMSKVTYITHSC